MQFQTGEEFAREMDRADPLVAIRERFHIPKQASGEEELYFTGNSLGLQPKSTARYVDEFLTSWQQRGVKGHFEGDYPWMPYQEFLIEQSARLVGAHNDEVVVMNSLTVNLHLMMVSFYRPTASRYKILIEQHAFPSDHYAVESQIRHHGLDPEDAMLLLGPREGEELIDHEVLYEWIERQGEEIALILLPGVQYYTGQALDMAEITRRAHAKGITVGFDLAHAAGNLVLRMHDWQADFACWCTYKYLNAGAGSVAGCFVHRCHARDTDKPRFSGWWGHQKSDRFEMHNRFRATPTAEGWQLSNPPVLSLAAIRAALDVIDEAGGITAMRAKSVKLTGYLSWLLKTQLPGRIALITPDDENQRGCQLSLTVTVPDLDGKTLLQRLEKRGVTVDWREPNVIRCAPAPLYNSFLDVYRFTRILEQCLS